MTLREQCEALLRKLGFGGGAEDYPEDYAEIEAFARQQQAVGLREAAKRLDEYNDDMGRFDPYLQKIVEWCEQRAREREGGV